LEIFRSQRPAFPLGEIDDVEECPDFVLHRDQGGPLGIEVTEIFAEGGNLLEEQAVLRRRVVELAFEKFAVRGGPEWEGVFCFNSSKRLSKASVQSVAEYLANSVAACSRLPKMRWQERT
jgi:uncharacterized protein YggL (DUF469 family)